MVGPPGFNNYIVNELHQDVQNFQVGYLILHRPKRVISAEIKKLLKKKVMSIAQQNIMNSSQVFSPGIKKMEVKE